MKYLKYNTKTMSNSQLWKCVLTPIEDKMPNELKKFLKECKIEFDKRKVKLYSIMDCKY